CLCLSMLPPYPSSSLLPYTTLFRSRVAVISKGQLSQGATYYAQGGIAAVLDDEDSIDAHIADTLDAGSGLCHLDMVTHIVEQSGDRKSTRLNSSHVKISYAVFCLNK